MDSFLLLCTSHNRLLRQLSESANFQFEGLQQASRWFAKKGKLDRSAAKKLVNIDITYNYMRHLTSPGAEQFISHILSSVGNGVPDTDTATVGELGEEVSSDAASDKEVEMELKKQREPDVLDDAVAPKDSVLCECQSTAPTQGMPAVLPSSRRVTFSDKPDIVEYATEAHVRQEDTPTCVSLPQAAWSCLFARSQHADIITEFQNVLDQSFAPRIRIDVERDARYGIFEHTFDIIFNEIHDTVSPGLCHMPPELRGILDQFLRRHVLILTCSLLLRGVCAEAEQ
eukprot:TRINITY_DN24088_c0_g1_i2.p1 TRINITY_DN24088_c0_g1~~TRINITY_DN24088_c0_g1_i2.p1  ORF type:complete len:312 (+),score=35.99 TRINITY_DN24088_c0_g1_i2:84-938(+)